MRRYAFIALPFATRAILTGLATLASAIAFTGCLTGAGSSGGLVKPTFEGGLAAMPKRMQLDSSWKALASLESQTAYTYDYTIASHSVFGFWDSTTVEVENGKPLGRSIVYQLYPDTGSPLPPVRITETVSNLGASEYGHSPVTLDSLYRSCRAQPD